MRIIVSSLLLVFLLVSCEKEIKIKVPEQPKKLVFYSVSYPGDPIRLILRSTVNALSYRRQPTNVTNATVILYDNGQVADTLSYDPAEEYYVSKTAAQYGHKYQLSAVAPGFPLAEATAEMPEEVPLQVSVTPNVRNGSSGASLDEVVTRFNDPGATTDYYRLVIRRYFTMWNSYNVMSCIELTDASLEQLRDPDPDQKICYDGSNIYLRDLLFNGRTKEIRFFANHDEISPVYQDQDSVYTIFTLEHYNEAYFRYLKSYEYLQYNDDNPFAEPANVYSNVKNGYGIFAFINRSTYEAR